VAAAALGFSLAGQATSGAPDIQVFDGTTNIPPGGTDAFGTTPVAIPGSRTFTVTNVGTADLLVSEAISVPPGFTLMASFPGVPDTTLPTNVPAFTIAPKASATFIVALNSATAGDFSGTVSFNTNVGGANPFTFAVTGRAVPPPAARYVDDLSADFTVTSGWQTNQTGAGTSGAVPFQQFFASAPPGAGEETATWTFNGLEPGQYRVWATWVGFSWAPTNTPFTVYDGANALGTVRVDQTADAAGFNDGASVWRDLGTFTISGANGLVVQMSNDANGYPEADGVRVERVGYPGATIDDSGPGFSTPTGTWYPGYTEPGASDYQGSVTFTLPTDTPGTPTATARWTFKVGPGTYRVMAAFNGYPWSPTNAPYNVYDGKTILTKTPILVDQTVRPTDLVDAAVGWKDLGFFTVASPSLIVELTNDANGQPVADAMRIERINAATIPSTADTIRFLEQAGWGPTPALIAQVQNVGFDAWINQQFGAQQSGYPTLPLYNTNDNITGNNTTSCYGDPTVSGNPARTACLRDNYSHYPIQNRFFTNALYGEDQLRQRMTWALHKIWVISGLDFRQPSWVNPYLQIMNNNAFGNYRTLMYQVTLNPAMGQYLSMAGSTRTNPNENYPREIMQLFTIGLNELNPDGTQKTTGSGDPIPTYDQTLVDNMTKVFTGWNRAPPLATNLPDYISPMRLNGAATENPVNHDFTSKNLLRGFVQIARSSSVANAYLDLNEGLDNIYSNPNVGPFVSQQLIQQLVTSNPSPGYVARVADTFNRNSTSDTQLGAVVRAILLDPEARGDRKNADNYGKLKEPVLYVNNLLRLFDAQSDDRTQPSDGYLNVNANGDNFLTLAQGQDVWNPPSVFSYFSPQKVAAPGNPPVLGPEFQIQTTTTALTRANFINYWAFFNFGTGTARERVRQPGTTPAGNPTGPLGTSVDVSFLLPYANDPSALADQLNTLMLHGTMTAEMKSDIMTAVNAVAANNPRKRVRTAVYLVATSSQYQVQQ
jgi:uncharacterized protein (DUF1800 family)